MEYHKIIAMLEEQASSFRGKQLCRRLKPMTDLERIDTAQEQTAAAFTRIVKRRPDFRFSDAFPVEESMKRLEIGAALGSGELLRICKVLKTTARAKAYGRHDTQDDLADCLDAYFEQLEPLTLLSNRN